MITESRGGIQPPVTLQMLNLSVSNVSGYLVYFFGKDRCSTLAVTSQHNTTTDGGMDDIIFMTKWASNALIIVGQKLGGRTPVPNVIGSIGFEIAWGRSKAEILRSSICWTMENGTRFLHSWCPLLLPIIKAMMIKSLKNHHHKLRTKIYTALTCSKQQSE